MKRLFIIILLDQIQYLTTRVQELEHYLGQNNQNSSNPPFSKPPRVYDNQAEKVDSSRT
ncbi:DUF6444 domain-containing protein [Paenibacillus sp. 8b26]|uniref:DUF6444 domain-containing protein n=1 Tax=Paenibacillus sp. 8b26 TaxID=3424133 RepID=UPI003D65AA3E